MQYRANTVICLFSSVFLFLVAPCLWAANLSGATFHRYRAEINRNVQQWKNSLKQYDSILENYEATSPKAKEQEKKVQSYYTKMRESCSNYYEHCANTYKKQLAEGVKKGAPMVQDLEKEIEILKVLGGKMKKTLTIEKQHELLTTLDVYNSFFNVKPLISSESNKNNKRMVKTIGNVQFVFRWCPPGTFMMGTPTSEAIRLDNEKQHKVTLTKGFWMLETEVTQKQWKAIMGTTIEQQRAKAHGNAQIHGEGDNYPMYYISWYECQEFCKRCKNLGLSVCLPTDAQWEYACRAGSTGTYAGDLNKMAWYKLNSNGKAHPVGTKKANAWGLYDMHGNVCEWCEDRFSEEYSDKDATDPVGPSYGTNHVFRGGAWFNGAEDCRSARCSNLWPDGLDFYLGFRVVIDCLD